MLPPKRSRGKTVSLYFDHRTVELIEELKQRGQAVSPILRELLQIVLTPTVALATVQYPLLPLGLDLDDDPFRFEKWIDAEKTKYVVLMGTTLYSALLNSGGSLKPLWLNLLQKGASLTVLLQGMKDGYSSQQSQFAFDAAAISRMKGESIDSIIAHSEAVKNALASVVGKYGNLQVGLATTAINYSAFLIRDTLSNLAVQVHPYTGMGDLNVRGVRFNFTDKGSRFSGEIEYQVGAFWKSAVSLK